MKTRTNRLTLVGLLALALSVTVGLAVSGQATAKKKKPAPSLFTGSKTVNTAIPDGTVATGPSTPVRSEIVIGKRFKGKTVGDVNVTIQSTGSAAGAANDLTFKLSAPNGRTDLIFESLGSQSIGPLKLDDDTRTGICNSATATCRDPDATLLQPFAGTANTLDQDDDMRPLSMLDGVRMKGTWTLTVYDNNNNLTSTFNQWSLEVRAAKAPK